MTTGFTGASAPKGPVAGFDPVMKFRKKVMKRKKIKEDNEIDRPIDMSGRSRLFQYKVNIPKVGETIVYANSPAQLTQK